MFAFIKSYYFWHLEGLNKYTREKNRSKYTVKHLLSQKQNKQSINIYHSGLYLLLIVQILISQLCIQDKRRCQKAITRLCYKCWKGAKRRSFSVLKFFEIKRIRRIRNERNWKERYRLKKAWRKKNIDLIIQGKNALDLFVHEVWIFLKKNTLWKKESKRKRNNKRLE